MNGKTTVLRKILVMMTVSVLMALVTTSAAETAQDSTGITWNFETGDLSGWTKTGTAFDYQPTYGDNPTARRRGQPSNHQGNYWIGTYEKYQGPGFGSTPGTIQGDKQTGTLTSIPFVINGNRIDFLIGGGRDCSADLIIDGTVVLTASGKNTETMERVEWDVSAYKGKEAAIQLVDDESAGWDHINFDDVRFDIPPGTPTVAPTAAMTRDCETGDLSGWTKTGTAFDYQPTYGDNPTARRRGQPSNHQGNYWIGTYEKYQGPGFGSTPGTIQGDKQTGTLTSIPFVINGNRIDFLIGGGRDCSADLIIDGTVVLTASGKNTETMERVEWDVSAYKGKEAAIQLVDDESAGWDHINFDDVRFDAVPTSGEVAPIQTPTPAVTTRITECDETARATVKAVGGCDAIDRAEYPRIYDACCKVTKEYILDLLNSALADGTLSPEEKKQLLKALDTYLGVRT